MSSMRAPSSSPSPPRRWAQAAPWLWFFVEGALTYALGAGVAHYLRSVDPARYLLGQMSVIWAQLAVGCFTLAFDAPVPLGRLREQDGLKGARLDPQRRRRWLWAGQALLAAQVLTLAALLWAGAPWLGVLTLALLTLLAVAYTVPPLQLAATGYGELTAAFALAGLIPLAGFTLQWGAWHRFLGLLMVPLMVIYLAVQIAREFPTYAADRRQGRRNLLQRVDWQRALSLHHLFLLSGFLLLALDLLAGLPWAVTAPALLGLLPAAGQMWLLQRLAAGRRPLWSGLLRLAAATFALTVYLLAVGFWMA